GRDGRLGDLADVAVGEDDVRGLAAQLEADPLDPGGGPAQDVRAGLGAAGEADLRHVRMLDQLLAQLAAGPGQDAEYAGRDTGRPAAGLQLERGQRGRRRGLEDHAVP